MSDVEEVEVACEVMHEAYERAAVETGWQTQSRSQVPWSEVPEPNKQTMRIAVTALLDHLSNFQAEKDDGLDWLIEWAMGVDGDARDHYFHINDGLVDECGCKHEGVQ